MIRMSGALGNVRVTAGRMYLSLPILLFGCLALAIGVVADIAGWDLLQFTAIYAAVTVPPFAVRPDDRPLDVFRPFVGLVVLLYLYSVSTLLFVQETGATYYGESVAAQDLATYRLACWVAGLGIAAGTLIAQSVPVKSNGVAAEGGQQRTLLVLIAACVAILAAPFVAAKFSPWLATAYGDVAFSVRLERLADQTAGVKEVLLEVLPITIILCGCTVLMMDSRRSWFLRALAGVVIGLYFATTLLSGWRSQLMGATLLVGVYFHYRVRPFRPYEMVLGGAIVYVLINVISVIRATSAPMEMIGLLANAYSDRGLQFLALGQSGELATSTNLLRLIAGIRLGESQFELGSVTLGQIAAFVPRPLMSARPPLASELFVMTFYPGVLESGGGYGFFMVQDGYWDFGVPGVFVYCLIYAFFVEVMYRQFRARLSSEIAVFAYALLYAQLVLGVVRSGIFSSLKAAVIALLPIVALTALMGLVGAAARARGGPGT